jgi:peptide/nickel transport system permease protein
MLSHLRASTGLQRGMLVTGLVLTTLVVLAAVLAPVLAPYGFAQLSDHAGLFGSQQPPSARNLLGTTVGGYDVLSRVIWGARTALLVIVAGVSGSLVVGVALGLVSGYVGGVLDRVLVVVFDAMFALPGLLLAIVVAIVVSGGQASLVGGIVSAAVAIGFVFVPQYFRVTRAETVRLKDAPFVESARVIGAPTARILVVHVLRNATRSLPLIITLNASESIFTLAGLGFLGFGIEPSSAAEWGYDLNKALSDTAAGIWWTGLFPGLAIVVTVLGLTLVGESLNDLADPRLRRRRVTRSRATVPDDLPGATA